MTFFHPKSNTHKIIILSLLFYFSKLKFTLILTKIFLKKLYIKIVSKLSCFYFFSLSSLSSFVLNQPSSPLFLQKPLPYYEPLNPPSLMYLYFSPLILHKLLALTTLYLLRYHVVVDDFSFD